MMKQEIGIYIHVPFCTSKCGYCDFYSFCGTEDQKKQYTEAVIRHLRDTLPGYTAKTVYIGGGTPTVLGTSALCAILAEIYKNASLVPGAEITVETNPSAAPKTDFTQLAAAGVNRVSLGVQSASAPELDALGRRHCKEDVIFTVDMLRRAGISNFNLDIMYGIPYQTMETLEASLSFICSLEPAHISAYAMKLEKNVPLYQTASSMQIPDDDMQADMYEYLVRTLSQRKYQQYEISNFAKTGMESRHNLNYWHSGEYLAFGPGASGYIDGKRYTFCRDLNRYIKSCCAGSYTDILEETEKIDRKEREKEFVMLNMRLCSGISFEEYRKAFGMEFEAKYGAAITPFLKSGHIVKNKQNISFTTKGFLLSNYILGQMIKF